MSWELAGRFGMLDRWKRTSESPPTGIIEMTETELLSLGASRVEWHEPDAQGVYTPTLYVDLEPDL